jgi:hypothetical protein
MPCALKTYDIVPPNCFQYPHWGRSPIVEELAKKESAFRRANGIPRGSYRECLEDVDQFNAEKVLGCDPRWTTPTESASIAVGEGAAGLVECHGCGAPI